MDGLGMLHKQSVQDIQVLSINCFKEINGHLVALDWVDLGMKQVRQSIGLLEVEYVLQNMMLVESQWLRLAGPNRGFFGEYYLASTTSRVIGNRSRYDGYTALQYHGAWSGRIATRISRSGNDLSSSAIRQCTCRTQGICTPSTGKATSIRKRPVPLEPPENTSH